MGHNWVTNTHTHTALFYLLSWSLKLFTMLHMVIFSCFSMWSHLKSRLFRTKFLKSCLKASERYQGSESSQSQVLEKEGNKMRILFLHKCKDNLKRKWVPRRLRSLAEFSGVRLWVVGNKYEGPGNTEEKPSLKTIHTKQIT